MFALREEWNRQKLVDYGYAYEETVKKMMVYRVVSDEPAFDPSQDRLEFQGSKLFCGVCLSIASRTPGAISEPIPLDDFRLRFKGPVSADSQHTVVCPKCDSRVLICGDALQTPAGPEPMITLHHETAPESFSRMARFQLPRLLAGTIELAQASETAPGA
jgi:hypothetical protein